MAKYVINDTTLTNIANAIREKTGSTSPITPENMDDEIAAIETGGDVGPYEWVVRGTSPYGISSGEIFNDGDHIITYNQSAWSYDVYDNATTEIIDNCFARVDVRDVEMKKVTSIPRYAFDSASYLRDTVFDAATQIYYYAFQNSTVKSIKIPSCTTICRYAFNNCPNLKTVHAKNVTVIQPNAFSGCTGLTSIDLPRLEQGERYSYIWSIFSGCKTLQNVKMPNAIQETRATFACTSSVKGKLAFCDMGSVPTVGAETFAYQPNLETVILRITGGAAALSSIDAFTGCTKVTSGQCTFYVPSALISTYQTATNWSVVAGYGCQFLPIEGSIYETYTVDPDTGEITYTGGN